MRLIRLVFAGSTLLAMFLALVVGSIVMTVVKRASADLPDHRALATYVPALASKLRSADGVLLASLGDENRKFVAYDAIPPLVVDAFVSAEDHNYWRHAGVDWSAVLRAAAANARAHSQNGDKRPEGGSSITQQVAKNLLVGDERSIKRKIREALVAMKLDRDLGKKRILEIYLNEVYLGAGSYGVAAAAETYFGKQLADLSPEEAALLAGMPKAPSSADPFRHPDRARERRAYVLRRLTEDGKLPAADLERLTALPINLAHREERQLTSSDWFVGAARRQLVQAMGNDLLLRGGFMVDTAIRTDLQRIAADALRRGIVKADQRGGWRGPLAHLDPPMNLPSLPAPPLGAERWLVAAVTEVSRDARVVFADGHTANLPVEGMSWTGARNASAILKRGDVVLVDASGPRLELQQMPSVEGALVALDPRTGNVLASVGGFSREIGEFDRATQAKRQPGSAFKTFVYMAGVTIGYGPSSSLLDVPFAIEQGPGQEWWRPADYGGGSGLGLIPMRRALELSRNMASARLLYEVGTPTVGNLTRKLGLDIPNPMPLSAGLGALETTPLALAAAYAAIANGGRVVRPRFVTRVSGVGAPTDVDFGGVGEQVVTPVEAALMQGMLRGVVERGTARKAFAGFRGWIAGKTGTTNESKDTWFVGVSPEIVVAVWIGRDDDKPLPGRPTGGSAAAPVVRDFLESTGSRFALAPPSMPPGAGVVRVDAQTGLPSDAPNSIMQVVRSNSQSPSAMPASSAPTAPAAADQDAEPD